MKKETKKRIEDVIDRLYNLNAGISACFITGFKKPSMEDIMTINDYIASEIKELRLIEDED
jgi:hypothetical protein